MESAAYQNGAINNQLRNLELAERHVIARNAL